MGTCKRGTTREREMYLHLLLLISPAFGMPTSDLIETGEEIINQFDSIPIFTEQTKGFFKNVTRTLYKAVAASLQTAEKNILELNNELKNLETEGKKYQTDYFPAFNKAKRFLRESRQKLRKLADSTVKEVTDLKALLKDLDETKDTVLLEISLDKMKDLMIETLETLRDALETYNSAQETFQNINSSVKEKNIRLKKMVTKGTEEYNDWVTKTREGVYGALTGATTALIIADIFGCLGICSAVNDAISKPLITATTEALIKEKLERFQVITSTMMKSGDYFDRTVKEAMVILNDEIDLIDRWTNSAKKVKRNINKYPTEYLKKYDSVRDNFIRGLDDLKSSAEEFRARPVEIF